MAVKPGVLFDGGTQIKISKIEILRRIFGPNSNYNAVGLGGLGVTCSPRDPRFAG